MKCHNCNGLKCFLDAELDLFFCEECGIVEGFNEYKAIPKDVLDKYNEGLRE